MLSVSLSVCLFLLPAYLRLPVSQPVSLFFSFSVCKSGTRHNLAKFQRSHEPDVDVQLQTPVTNPAFLQTAVDLCNGQNRPSSTKRFKRRHRRPASQTEAQTETQTNNRRSDRDRDLRDRETVSASAVPLQTFKIYFAFNCSVTDTRAIHNIQLFSLKQSRHTLHSTYIPRHPKQTLHSTA